MLDQTSQSALPVVAYQAHAFSNLTHFTEAQQGQTVAQMVASLNLPADYEPFVHVWINDLPLEREQWEHVIPAEGKVVYVRVIPQGGGGKDVLRTVAAIAIAVVAVATGQYYAAQLGFTTLTATGATALTMTGQFVAASIAAGVTIVGNMALNALIPPPKLELNPGSGLGSQRNQLTGSSNRFAPYAPIPRVFGRRRVYPLLAGRPYSESQGDNEYLRMALLVGWGPLRITDLRIGETPITAFADVEYEVREGWDNDAALTLYTNTITEAGYSILLAPAVGASVTYNTRTTDAGVTEISVDITAPAGIAKFESNGNRSSIDVDVQVQYALAGTGNWQTPVWLNSADPGLDANGRIRMGGAETSTMRRTGRFSVPAGQYDVRVHRSTTEYATNQHVQEVRWTTMRSIKPSYPVQQSGLCLIALRMKATGQLNGVPAQINCLAESYLPVYNGSTWSYAITRNPAWAFADVLRRRGNASYLSDDRIDLAGILAWATACDATAPNASEPYWAFDGVIEGGSVFQVLRQIATSARANYTVRDGKHSVVRDILQTVPIQHITPRNSFGYSGTKTFLDYPHALRVVFTNAAKNYEEDERIVYDDGYSAGNATKFETLELYGCTSATQAYREGRYFLAAARLRPETHTVSMDIENLRCNLGDLVRFSHDVVSIGIAAARIVSVLGNTVVLDQEMTCSLGTTYAIRVRASNGDAIIVSLQDPGATTTATFTATSSLAGVAEGDLAMFGVMGSVTAPMIVKKIEPGPDFTAKLHLVDAQAGVYTADTGVIPAFNSNITTTTPIEEQRPGAPAIFSVRSDDSVALLLPDGTLQVRIAVSLTPPASSRLGIDAYDVQWRAVGAANWIEERYPRGTPIFLSPVQVDVAYQIRARAVSTYGVAGDWSGITTHTVTGKDAPPSNVVALTAAIKPGLVEIKWTAATDPDYDLTELRLGASWAAGTVLWKGAASTFSWPRPTNGAYTIWAAHRDTSGNYSAAPVSVAVTVTNAIDPQRTILLTIYRRSAATPSLPSGNATYDFATNALSGLDNSWQTTAPAGADPLWVSTATTTGNVTDTITPAEWSAPTILLQDGTNGLTTAVVELFQRTGSASAPSVDTSGNTTYTFATNGVSGQPSGWLNQVPSGGGGYLWVIRATAASTGATDTVANTEWTAPVLLAQDGAPGAPGATGAPGAPGVDGSSTALVYIYQRAASQPALPTQTVTYTFATGNIATLNNGWSATVPAGSNPLWVAAASAVSTSGVDTIAANEWSSPVVLAQNGTNGSPGAPGNPGADGLNSATVYLFQRTSGSTPSVPSANVTYTFATAAASGVNNGWSQTMPTSGGTHRWMTTATAAATGASDVIAPGEWAAPALVAQDGTNGTNGSPGSPGANGTQAAVVYLYQWSTVQPANPGGSSAYTWSAASHTGYTSGDGWSTTVPSNPGTPGARLWVASKSISDTATATATTVSWASGITVSAWSQNGNNGSPGAAGAPGANGVQSATFSVFQWAVTQPAGPTGTGSYSWASGSFGAAPSGWSLTPGAAPSLGFTLWAASLTVLDSAANSSTFFNWVNAGVSARGYAGTNGAPGAPGATGAVGASARIAYARIPNNPTPITGTVIQSGDDLPSFAASAGTWGLNTSWSTTDPNPSSTDTLYVCDGIYNSVSDLTAWSTPYVASLKVGQLSAITANIGLLRTTGSGGRLELQDNVIRVYDNSNVLRVKIGNLLL